ncbi:MAG: YbhN family protein [Promethearchaeota archaeon]
MSNERTNKTIYWLKKRKRLLIGLATLALMIFLVFIVDFPSFVSKIIVIGIWGLTLFIITYTIAFLLRAYKLKLVFKGLDQPVKFSTCYFSIGAGFILNELTPGKVGDLVKIFIIKDQEDIRISESVAGIAIERVLDIIFLFLISCFALVYLYLSNLGEIGEIEILGQNIQFYLILGAILIALILTLFLLLLYKTDLILSIIKRISKKLALYIERFLNNFKEGIRRFKDHKIELIYIILLSIPTWVIDALVVVLFFYLLGYNLNIFLLILATMLLFFSKIFPITPGGWGISENIGALFLFIFYYEFIPYQDILSIFIIDHIFRSVYLFVYGGYSVIHYNVNLKKSKELIL